MEELISILRVGSICPPQKKTTHLLDRNLLIRFRHGRNHLACSKVETITLSDNRCVRTNPTLTLKKLSHSLGQRSIDIKYQLQKTGAHLLPLYVHPNYRFKYPQDPPHHSLTPNWPPICISHTHNHNSLSFPPRFLHLTTTITTNLPCTHAPSPVHQPSPNQ